MVRERRLIMQVQVRADRRSEGIVKYEYFFMYLCIEARRGFRAGL